MERFWENILRDTAFPKSSENGKGIVFCEVWCGLTAGVSAK